MLWATFIRNSVLKSTPKKSQKMANNQTYKSIVSISVQHNLQIQAPLGKNGKPRKRSSNHANQKSKESLKCLLRISRRQKFD